MLVSILPKLSVSSFMGYLKGKNSLMIFDRHANLKYKYGNRNFWCKCYYVDPSGNMCDPPSDVLKRALKEGERFDDLSDEQKELIAEYYRERVPIISIPEGVKGKAQSKNGYEQISYKWKDGDYKYEARWHTRTPDAPENQGRTWVIERVKPGNGGVKPSRHF